MRATTLFYPRKKKKRGLKEGLTHKGGQRAPNKGRSKTRPGKKRLFKRKPQNLPL